MAELTSLSVVYLVGRLWEVVELIPQDATGTPREVRGRLTAQLSSA